MKYFIEIHKRHMRQGAAFYIVMRCAILGQNINELLREA